MPMRAWRATISGTAIVLAFLHPNIPLGDCLVQVAKILWCFDLGSCFREDKEQAVLVRNPLFVLLDRFPITITLSVSHFSTGKSLDVRGYFRRTDNDKWGENF